MRIVRVVFGIVFQMPCYGVDQRAVVVSASRMHYQSGRFVDYHQIVVLIDRGGSPGDLVARIVIEVPTRLTGRQRGQLEDLAKALDPSNFPEAQSFGSKMKVFYQHRDKLRK